MRSSDCVRPELVTRDGCDNGSRCPLRVPVGTRFPAVVCRQGQSVPLSGSRPSQAAVVPGYVSTAALRGIARCR